jgi:hypothetical protein
MTSPASYQVLLQFTVSSTVDITTDVEEISFERRLATFQDPLSVGQAQIQVGNEYGRFTPTNSNSALDLYPGLGVQISGVASGSGGSQVLFKGTIDEYLIQLSPPAVATFRASDDGKKAIERETLTKFYISSFAVVNTMVAEALNFASITNSVTAHTGSAADIHRRRNFGYGGGITAAEVVDDFCKTGGYIAFVSGDGVLRVNARNSENSGTTVTTYTQLYDLSFGINDETVINQVRCRGPFFKPQDDNNVVDGLNEPIMIVASGFVNFLADYIDQDEVTRVHSPQFLAIRATQSEDGSGGSEPLSRTITLYATTAVVSLFNGNGFDIWVNSLAFQGRVCDVKQQREVVYDDAASQTTYGVRRLDAESDNWGPTSAMSLFKDYVFARYTEPLLRPTATIRDSFPFILTTDVSDKLSIVHSLSGIKGAFAVMGKRDRITAAQEGWIHEATYDLQEVR